MNLPPPSLSGRVSSARFSKSSYEIFERFREIPEDLEFWNLSCLARQMEWTPECTDGCVTLTVPWVELVEVRHLRGATRHLWRDLGPSAYGALCPFLTSTERFQCQMKALKGSFQFESDPFWIRKGWKVRCADEQRLVAHSSASWSETRIRNWEAAQWRVCKAYLEGTRGQHCDPDWVWVTLMEHYREACSDRWGNISHGPHGTPWSNECWSHGKVSRHGVWATDISLKSDVCVFGFFVCDFFEI